MVKEDPREYKKSKPKETILLLRIKGRTQGRNKFGRTSTSSSHPGGWLSSFIGDGMAIIHCMTEGFSRVQMIWNSFLGCRKVCYSS